MIFLSSLAISIFIIRFLHYNLKKIINSPTGPQKIHKGDVSRLGGLSIFLTLALIVLSTSHQENFLFLNFFIISIPVFLVGLLEDITQLITPKIRLVGSLLSGVLFIFIFQLSIKSIGIYPFDLILNYKIFSILFTLLCITYLIQAFNIIDGLNGLSLTTGILSFLAISIIAYQVGDEKLFSFSVYFIFILLGVLALNFPYGKIFIGDAGAYIIGLYVSLSVIILIENNINISPFVIVQILIYPSYELFRSIVRRVIEKKNILKPDRKHLHSLIYTLNIQKLSSSTLKTNVYASLQIIILQMLNFIFVINFFKSELIIIFGIIVFIIFYEIIYHKVITKIKNKNNSKYFSN